MNRSWGSWILFTILSLSIGLTAGCSPRPEKPHVILLTLDTLRADGLGVWERQSVVPGQAAGLFPLHRGHRLPPGGGEKQSIKPCRLLPSPLGAGEVCA